MSSFSFDVKNELISKELTRKQTISLIDGIIFSSYKKDNEDVEILFKSEVIFNKINEILEASGKSFKIKNKKIIFKDINSQSFLISDPQSFFSGVFIAHGSISSLSSSSYHLEFKVKNENIAKLMLTKLNIHELNFSSIHKNDYTVLYIKKNDQISEFLKAIGSQESFFKFFDAVISRDHKNQITRIGNLDIYNQSKLVDSNALFLESYKFVKENHLLKKFKENELIFFEFKVNNPYLPLSQISEELASKYNILKTKSGLNHWLRKIRKISEDYEYRMSKKINR